MYCDGRRTVRVGVEIGNSLTMMISANSVRWGGDRVMMMMMMMMMMMAANSARWGGGSVATTGAAATAARQQRSHQP